MKQNGKGEYQEVIANERKMEEDGRQRESGHTGGSSGSETPFHQGTPAVRQEGQQEARGERDLSQDEPNGPAKEKEEDDEEDYAKPKIVRAPKGPSQRERERRA